MAERQLVSGDGQCLAEHIDASLVVVGLDLEPFGLPFLMCDVAQAFFECGDFAKPLHPASFG